MPACLPHGDRMSNFQNHYYDINDPALVGVIDDLPLWSAPFGQKILDIVRMRTHMHVLDVGCGLGFPLVELSQRLGVSCHCFGIDPWKAAIKRAREKAHIWGISNVEFYEGVAEDLPFENQMFDVVLSNNGLNNVDDEIKSVQEISRVCKPGGQLILTFNLDGTFAEFYNPFKNVLQRLHRHTELDHLAAHIYAKRKPVDYWIGLVERHKFVVDALFYDTFRFRYNDGTSMLNHFFIKMAFLPSWRDLIAPDNIAQIFCELEQELNLHAAEHGELVLSVPWVTIKASKKFD